MVRISSKLSRRTAVAFLALAVVALAFLALATARLRSRTVEAGNGMRRIALTIENYKLATGYFPSATQISDDGRHFHSWRIRAIGHMCRIDYRGAYDFDRPWNSPGNVDLGHGPLMGKAAEVRIWGPPRFFHSPRSSGRPPCEDTNYLLVTGKRTVSPPDKLVSERDIVDGLDNTLIAIEVLNTGIHWLEPLLPIPRGSRCRQRRFIVVQNPSR